MLFSFSLSPKISLNLIIPLHLEVPPRLELRSLDSKSSVFTFTVENINRTIVAMIAKHAKTFGCNWDLNLFAYRTKPHESTRESPFFLLYGQDARLPTDTAFTQPLTPYLVDVDDYKTELMVGLTESWKHARQCIGQAQAKQKKYYDKHPRSKTVDFVEKSWSTCHKKLRAR